MTAGKSGRRSPSEGTGVSADMIGRVLNRVARAGSASRSEISKGTMLAHPVVLASGTVGKAADVLIDKKLLRLGPPREGQPGPKATPLRLSHDWVIAGIHLDQQHPGPDVLTGVLCGLDRQRLAGPEAERVPKQDGKHELRGLTKHIRTLIEKLQGQLAGQTGSSVPAPQLFAVGIELGGHVYRGTVIDSTHALWAQSPVPLGDALTRELGGVPVIVENDVNVLAIHSYFERRFDRTNDRAHDATNVALIVVFRQGVGGGLLLDGRMYRGSHGLAPEPGHLFVEYHSDETKKRRPARRAVNGRTFDDECLCSTRDRKAYGHVDTLATPVRIEGQLAALKPNQKISLEQAAKAPRDLSHGDQVVLTEEATVFRRAGQALGRGLAHLINIVNPGQLVLRLPAPLAEAAAQTAGAEYLANVEREIDTAYSTGPRDARGDNLQLTVETYADGDIAEEGAKAAATAAFNAFIEHIRGFDGCHPASEEDQHSKTRRSGRAWQAASQPA